MRADRLRHYAARLREERRQLGRFVASRLLWRTGLGARLGLRVRLRNNIAVRFGRSSVAATLWVERDYGLAERELVARLLEPGATMIDVGANIGVLSLVAAAAVGARGRVLALEPHPATFAQLVQNADESGLRMIVCRNVAAGPVAATVRFSDLTSDDQNHLVGGGEGPVAVRMETLDELAANLGEVTLLKIDVEGFEQGVLAGAPAVLSRTRHVLVECSERMSHTYGFEVEATLALLERQGFELLVADTLAPPARPWAGSGVRNVLGTRDRTALACRTET
jgi:FkbM family methyltransferase